MPVARAPDTSLDVRLRDDGTALIAFLAAGLNTSRRRAKALLDRKAVLINDRPVWMAHHRLKAGDRIRVLPAPPPARQPGLLFRDEHIVVADKPAGRLSNGSGSIETDLRASLRCPSLTAVHRLDRDTTGCLVLALHAQAQDAMIALFRRRKILKFYHAIVAGRVVSREGLLRAALEGKATRTAFRRLSATPRASHLLVRIDTGRTHQIRRHLAGMGHPVLGDRTYVPGHAPSSIPGVFRRQMLHASELRFAHPLEQTPLRIQAPLPADFRNALQRLRLD